jgi:hypothetical protein
MAEGDEALRFLAEYRLGGRGDPTSEQAEEEER